MVNRELHPNVKRYLEIHGISAVAFLGDGTDGCVWKTDRATAIKVFDRERQYLNERNSYQRLLQYSITSIDGFAIPKLVGYDNELLIVEMGIVAPPRILDFGKVWIDRPPDFSEETAAEHEARMEELWGEQLPQVKSIVWQLERIGIYYLDPSKWNIRFENEPE